MSGGLACRCKVALALPPGQRPWRVRQYGCNHSAFNGYHETPSDYSEIVCDGMKGCDQGDDNHGYPNARWRTKAAYVSDILGNG